MKAYANVGHYVAAKYAAPDRARQGRAPRQHRRDQLDGRAAGPRPGTRGARHHLQRGGPGIARTDNTEKARTIRQAWDQAARFSVLGCVGQPADIADLWPSWPPTGARWITRQRIDATGGWLLRI
jgi:hypothetical protein